MSKKKKKKLTTRISWHVEYAFYRLLERILCSFSLASVYHFGELIGSIYYRISPSYRSIVRRNLRVVMSESSALATPTDLEIETVFRRNGGNLLSTIVAHKIKAQDLSKHLEIEGIEEIRDTLGQSGAILMLAHMGNWEVLTKFTSQLPKSTPMGALYRALNNPYMNQLILRRRESAGMTLVNYKNPAFTLLRLLKKRGIVSILSDQRIGAKGETFSFFGCPTPCSRLPYLLHEKTGNPLFTVTMQTLAPAQWKITFKKQENLTQQEAFDALATEMQSSHPDCFWFQDRWQEFPNFKSLQEIKKCPPSTVFKHKRLTCILESRKLTQQYPLLEKRLSNYDIIYWDEGANPADAYIAIHDDNVTFKKSCNKHGLKRGCRPIKVARRMLRLGQARSHT